MTGRRAAVSTALALALLLAGCSSGGGAPDDDALAPATGAPAAAESGYAAPVLLGTLADPDITESSGLVASRRNPGSYWTHNDSGGEAVLYCVASRGESCGTWEVTGARNLDWEDVAAGPGPEAGTPYLYAGDIGDNGRERDTVVVYRVPEPATSAPAATGPAATVPAEALRFRYPDGPHDAEALLVHPESGDVYIVVKEADPGVYVARAPLAASEATTLTKVAELAETFSPVSGGDIAPDGRRVALCNYGQGLELRLPDGVENFDDVWQQRPRPVSLGVRLQGEAVAYRLDGQALLATSERRGGVPAPLLEVVRG